MGNSMTRARLRSEVKQFMVDWAKAGNTHHMSLCLGQQTGVIAKLSKALPDVTFKKVD
jgi:L-arabinose isomerase